MLNNNFYFFMTSVNNDCIFFYILPDIFWVISIFILIIFGLIFSMKIKSLYLSCLIIDLAKLVIFFSFFFIIIYLISDFYIINFFTIYIDYFYLFFRLLFLIFFLFCLFASKNVFFLDKIYLFEFPILIFLSAEGSFLMLMTDNLFTFYLALEMQNLCFYILASLKRYSNFSTEAGLKYFLLGAFSSSILLFGISLLYGILGTLDLKNIYILLSFYNFEHYNLLLFISFFFLLSGLLFKLGSAPFHYWVPDVYEGSPTIVTMFFSVMPKLVLTFVFVKFYFYLFSFELRFFSIYLFICGFLSLIIGIYNAMFQNNLKRFFAYSSIVNVGFILISFSIMDFNGFFSGLFFLFCYLFSIILIFYLILNYRQISLKEFNTLFDLSLLNNSSNLILYIFSLIFLSFAGIPPLIGFFGKFFVFFSLFNSFNYLILLLLLLLSVISGFYYLRIIRFIFFSKVFEYVYFNFYNNSYLFIFIIFFNLFFIFFFDFCCEYIYFIMVKSFI